MDAHLFTVVVAKDTCIIIQGPVFPFKDISGIEPISKE